MFSVGLQHIYLFLCIEASWENNWEVGWLVEGSGLVGVAAGCKVLNTHVLCGRGDQKLFLMEFHLHIW